MFALEQVLTDEDLTKFHSTLNKMLVDYKDFTFHIARGFKETQMHMNVSVYGKAVCL